MEPPYDNIEGVKSTISGYIGGHVDNPSYKQVTSGRTGHTEAVQILYDPNVVSYDKLLEVFWLNIDPFTPNAQFCDHGPQYRTAIFTHSQEQAQLAAASKAVLEEKVTSPIVTELGPAPRFYAAEDYHQDYYLKNPVRYKYYRYRCGRDQRLTDIWGARAGGGTSAVQ